MPRPIKHGTESRYKAGCRCPECVQAKARLMRVYREAKVNGPATEQPVGGPGPVEAALLADLAGFSSAQSQSTLAAAGLQLARVLDNPRAVTTKPAAARQLTDILERLRKSEGGRKSRLASVRELSA